MAHLVLLGFAGTLAHACDFLPRVRYTRHGRLRFLRVGRLHVSWCVCKQGLR